MKKIVKTPKVVEKVVEKVTVEEENLVEVDGGAVTLLGKTVYVGCASYAYTGLLTGANANCIEITEPSIVYETGNWTDKAWKNAQRLPCKSTLLYLSQVESLFAVEW